MKPKFHITFLMLVALFIQACTAQNNDHQLTKTDTMGYNQLTPDEAYVILQKGTEPAFKGIYTDHKAKGPYVCKQCNASLYRSNDKFESHCGWPSFDDEIEGAVKRNPDADGRRVEIVCANCGGHLGHVFEGEGFTSKDTRHCVNSISLNFIAADSNVIQKAIFAGGCFWGVEYFLQQQKGVKSVVSGYIGGSVANPTYEDVCSKTSGHIEAVEVTYDSAIVDFETLAKLFFEIHDPTQLNRQGPDVGEQYKSAIFYVDENQKAIAEKLIQQLKAKNINVVTELIPATKFWEAEAYHQNYYERKGSKPYCHGYVKRF